MNFLRQSCRSNCCTAPVIPGNINVIDNLYSDRTQDALSANMGRVLRLMIEALEARVAILEALIDEFGSIQELIDLINWLVTQVNLILQRLTVIEQDIVNIKGDITTIFNRLQSIDQSITNINNAITNIQGDITNIKNDITNIQGDITNINNEITDIKTDITNIQGDITNINNEITDIKNEITNIIGSDIEEIQAKLDTIEEGALKNVQSDWNVTSTTSDAYIKNKPNIPSNLNLVLSTGQSTTDVMSQKAVTDAIEAALGGPGFGKVVVGGTTVAAATPNDTINLVAGANIAINPDATGKSVTISSTGGGANILHKSVTIPASGWSNNTYTVTDADIVDGCTIEAYPAFASLAAFEVSDAYADLQPTVGQFVITVRNAVSTPVTINYSIIG